MILDFRRVQGLDVSAVFNLGKLEQTCRQHGVRLLLTGLRPQLRRQMDLAGLTGRATVLPTLDEALALIEEEVLAEDGGAGGRRPAAGFGGLLARAVAPGRRSSAPEPVARRHRGPAPGRSLRLPDPAGAAAGSRPASTARAAGRCGSRPSCRAPSSARSASTPESPRTATVAADVDSTIRRVTRDSLEQLAERDPALARDFHALVAALLARRLTRTTALLREFSR